MRASNVLIVGVRGLSCEVAKNLVLAGVGALTLLDSSIVEEADLAANFLLTKEHIGKNVSCRRGKGEVDDFFALKCSSSIPVSN